MSDAAANAETAPDEQHEHVLPLKVYFGVYGALLVFTYITIQVSYLDLGQIAIYVAMAVAIIKAFLVVGYFMHLKFDVRFNSLIFLGSLMFLAIFFVLTGIDLASRGDVVEQQDTFVLRHEQAAEKRLKQEQEQAANKAAAATTKKAKPAAANGQQAATTDQKPAATGDEPDSPAEPAGVPGEASSGAAPSGTPPGP